MPPEPPPLPSPPRPGVVPHRCRLGVQADLDWTRDQSKMVIVDGDGGPNNRAVCVSTPSRLTAALALLPPASLALALALVLALAFPSDSGLLRREIDAKTFKVVTSWGGLGGPATKGKFNISHGVAIDHCNRVWVADRCAHQTGCHLTPRPEDQETSFGSDCCAS